MITLRRLLLLASATFPACSGSSPPPADSASSSSTSSTVANASPAESAGEKKPNVACPRTGKWALCSVETRLVQSGFVVSHIAGDPPRRDGFSVAPAAYKLGRTRLEVFIYPSESALSADVAKMDTVFAAPRGSRGSWGMGLVPTFVRSGNLAAVFLTDNPTQAERFTLAITAGAPQP